MLCRHCHKLIGHEISNKTAWAYQYHVKCRPWAPYNVKTKEREATKQVGLHSKGKGKNHERQ